MTNSTLLALMSSLTHSVDGLERICSHLEPHDVTAILLTIEIKELHTTIDGLNELYLAQEDSEKIEAFENVGK